MLFHIICTSLVLGQCVAVDFCASYSILSLLSKREATRKTVGTAGTQPQTFSAQQPKFGETLLL